MATPDPQTLASVPLFGGLSEADLEKVAGWLQVETYPAGHVLAREDKSGYAFYIMGEGQAHAEHAGKELEVLKPGAVFGEMAFFDPKGRRTADVIMDTSVTIYSMFGTHFREVQMQMPEVAARLEALATERAERERQAEAT